MRDILVCILCLLSMGFVSEIEAKKIPKDLRQPADSNSSLLALSFLPLKAFSYSWVKKVQIHHISVLFVKLEPGGNRNEPQMIASNYSKKGRAYLINAKPGKYAAAALLVRFKTPGIGISIGTGGVSFSPTINEISEATFFSQQIVNRSTIEVKPGELAFMGEFRVNNLPDINKADPVQERYYRRFIQLVKKNDPALANVKIEIKKIKKKPKRRCKRGVLTDYFSLNNISLKIIERDFMGTGWSGMIREKWPEVLDKKDENTGTVSGKIN